jgi:hypothetical protein
MNRDKTTVYMGVTAIAIAIFAYQIKAEIVSCNVEWVSRLFTLTLLPPSTGMPFCGLWYTPARKQCLFIVLGMTYSKAIERIRLFPVATITTLAGL